MFDTWSIWVYKFHRCLFFHQIGIALVPLGSPPHRLHAATPIKQICQRGLVSWWCMEFCEQLDPKNGTPKKMRCKSKKKCCLFSKQIWCPWLFFGRVLTFSPQCVFTQNLLWIRKKQALTWTFLSFNIFLSHDWGPGLLSAKLLSQTALQCGAQAGRESLFWKTVRYVNNNHI